MITTDICVIGGGAGGLSLAAGAVQMGAKVVLVERAHMGGDCLHYGCVPSKSLLAAAHQADAKRQARNLGITHDTTVDYGKVHAHIQRVIDTIAEHDSEERFTELGVEVIRASARFIDRRTIIAGDQRIRAQYIVIATGSRPRIPDIAGLDQVPFFTNETIFSLTELPSHLVVVGGGPIGMEMAFAHAQLGSKVTVLTQGCILPHDDTELVAIVRQECTALGIDIVEQCSMEAVAQEQGCIGVNYAQSNGSTKRVVASHLLIATGRQPNVEDLDLAKAGVQYNGTGIQVNARLRTTARRIYAMGDVTGWPQFTHIAGYHAGIVIRNILFKLPAKTNYQSLPWVTYLTPELAHVGLNWEQASARFGAHRLRLLRMPFSSNDRAMAEGTSQGLVKVIVGRRGRIYGVSMLGPHAGELIQPWCLAIHAGLGIQHMAGYIAPYPTLAEINKRVAGSYYTKALFSSRTQKIVRFLLKCTKSL